MDKIKEYETVNEMYLDVPKDAVGAEVGVCKGWNAVPLYHITKPKNYICVTSGERDIPTPAL